MWREGTTEGHFWQAKVYEGGSVFGIGGGRISKLFICEAGKRSACVFNYDRGRDVENCPAGVLMAVMAAAIAE